MPEPLLTPDERAALADAHWTAHMVRATGLRPTAAPPAPPPTLAQRLAHAEQRLAVLARRVAALEEQLDE